MILYSAEQGGKIMKAALDEIWNALLELESSNNTLEAEIENVTQEFDDLVEKADQGISVIEEDEPNNSLAIYENRLVLDTFVGDLKKRDEEYARYENAKNKVISIVIATAIFLGVSIPLAFGILHLGVGFGIFCPLLGSGLNIFARRKSIKEYRESKNKCSNIDDNIQKQCRSKKICQRLWELSDKAHKLAASKEENKKEFDRLRSAFVETLEQEIEKRYHEEGINEKVEIESATIIANSINMLSLELKGESDKK